MIRTIKIEIDLKEERVEEGSCVTTERRITEVRVDGKKEECDGVGPRGTSQQWLIVNTPETSYGVILEECWY